MLSGNTTNPSSCGGRARRTEVLALQLSVDFSIRGSRRAGLANLHRAFGSAPGPDRHPGAGTLANSVLGELPASAGRPARSVSGLVSILDAINQNFDGGDQNNGYLQ